MAAEKEKTTKIRLLCKNLLITNNNEPRLQWLVGSQFFPHFTIASTLRSIHTLPSKPLSPDYPKESGDLQTLLPKGFEVIGALICGDSEHDAVKAIDAAREVRKVECDLIGAVSDLKSGNVRFFIARSGSSRVECVGDDDVVVEDQPEKYVWERGCLLLCRVPIKLPVYCAIDSPQETEDMYSRAIDAVAAQFKDPKATYLMETLDGLSAEVPSPLIVRGVELNFAEAWNSSRSSETVGEAKEKDITCSYFCSKSRDISTFLSTVENADKIQVSVLLDRSEKTPKLAAPVAEYFPASKDTKLLIVDFKLEVLCYAKKDVPIKQAVSTLIIPGLLDQLYALKNSIKPNLSGKHPQLHPYHFCPPGFVHPVTVIHELSSRETEMKQVEVRRSLHLRLGLPLDRPLLRMVNAINLSASKDSARDISMSKGSTLLKNVHLGIPSSGVSGGVASLVQGSYEYYHYLQDGFDDSGWGCAYRSLQTIISWFRLQHYSSIDVPSHREIQQSLVDIEDKDPSFIGSREWIGAIELSFVLDKLLDVTCKVINVRSGAELPEKCRELALHFETQGTPVMIGGGVLAYTLLGVDFNEASGDCAFLILDPHYTGGEDLKKIVNGGWCGWKKAVDSKGNHFFLQNKFYNLLLPQRPNMV